MGVATKAMKNLNGNELLNNLCGSLNIKKVCMQEDEDLKHDKTRRDEEGRIEIDSNFY